MADEKQEVTAVVADQSATKATAWLSKNWVPLTVGGGIVLTLCLTFCVVTTTAFNNGFDSGKRAGIEETRGAYAKAPWYIRGWSFLTGELPK